MNRKILLKQAQRNKKPATGGDKDKSGPSKHASNPSPATTTRTTAAIPDIQLISYERTATGVTGYKARAQSLTQTYDITSLPTSAILCVRIPASPSTQSASQIQRSTTECILSAQSLLHLYNLPNLGRAPPAAQFASLPYTIKKSDISAGAGMFATRSLEVGDLILVERPLIVAPFTVPQLTSSGKVSVLETLPGAKEMPMNALLEATLEVAYNRLPVLIQEAYLRLSQVHGQWGTLSSIWRTNMIEVTLGQFCEEMGKGYSAVCEKVSRVNHSCTPNCTTIFDPASFSLQLRATRPIKSGDELVRAYINPIEHSTPTERKDALKPFGFTCSCTICSSPSPPSLSIRDTYKMLKATSRDLPENPIANHRDVYNSAKALMNEMEGAKLDGVDTYRHVLDLCISSGMALGAYIAPKMGKAKGKDADSGEIDSKEFKRIVNEAKKLEKIAKRYALAHDGCFAEKGAGGLNGLD